MRTAAPWRSPRSSSPWPAASTRSAAPEPPTRSWPDSTGTGSCCYIWPVVDLPFDEINAIARRLTPLTEGLGLEQVVVNARLQLPTSDEPVDAVLRLGLRTRPRTHGAHHRTADGTDAAARRLHAQAHPDSSPWARPSLRAGPDARRAAVARSSSTTSTTRGGSCRCGGEPGQQRSRRRRRRRDDAARRLPGGHHPGRRARRSDEGDGGDRRGGVRADHRGDRPGRRRWACRSSGSPSPPGPRSPWTRAARTSTGSPVCCGGSSSTPQRRWRGQRRRRRDQRRRPAVLERRGDDADAHQRHPRDDPGQRDGAHRQAGDRLLRRRLGRGQPRHRRLRQDHGTQRRGPVLRPDDRRRRRRCSSSTTASRTGRRASAWPRRDRHRRPIRSRRQRLTRTPVEGSEFTTVGEIFSESANRDRKKPFDIRTVIGAVVDADHEVLERWPEMAEAETAVVCDARLGGYAGHRPRHRVTTAPPPWPRRRRRPGAVVDLDAGPAGVREDDRAIPPQGEWDPRRRAHEPV